MLFLDDLLEKGGGYVLNFSDRTFAQFFAEELNLDIDDPAYAVNGGSKGKRLRHFLQTVDKPTVVRTLNGLWEYRDALRRRSGKPDQIENAHGQLLALINRLEGPSAPASPAGTVPIPAFDRPKIAKIKANLVSLSSLAPQARGYAFETFLKDLFDAYGLAAQEPFRLRGEQHVFGFYPFIPDPLPDNWRAILRAWLLGERLAAIAVGQESETLQFIEGGLVYRLPWAMEAVRVRAAANGDTIPPFGMALDDHELGLAVPAVETGTMNRSASILIQAGFNSRLAAIKAVTDTGATFTTGPEPRQWLNSDGIAAWTALPDWPTVETKAMWTEFTASFTPRENRTWADRRYWAGVAWSGAPPPPGTLVQLHEWNGQRLVAAADGTPLGALQHAINPLRRGLIRASVSAEAGKVDLSYLGPDDLVEV